MLSIYIFSLVLGGSFLLVSLLGDFFEADADVDVDFDTDFDLSDAADAFEATEALEAVDAAEALDAADAADLSDAGGTEALKIFSIRGLIYTLFGFGAVGSLLTWMGQGTSVGTLVAAIVGGLLTGGVVTVLFNWLRATGTTNRPGDRGFVGVTGHVTLPMAEGSPGTVVVDRGSRRITLRALPFPGVQGDPSAWSSVVVVEMERGIARVAPVEDDLALEP